MLPQEKIQSKPQKTSSVGWQGQHHHPIIIIITIINHYIITIIIIIITTIAIIIILIIFIDIVIEYLIFTKYLIFPRNKLASSKLR